MKPRPDDPTSGPPCPGCHGPHDLRACADLRGSAVLRERGRLMSAVEAERQRAIFALVGGRLGEVRL